MARSAQKVGTLVRAAFSVFDGITPVTGILPGAFASELSRNGVDNATAVTISEIGDGRYQASFTPPAPDVGHWRLTVSHPTYAPRGFAEDFDVTTDGLPSVADVQSGLATAAGLAAAAAAIVADTEDIQARLPAALVSGKIAADVDAAIQNAIADALLDRANAIDTHTPRQALKLMAAVLCGKLSGSGTVDDPYVFLGIDGTTVRVTSVANAAGLRTAVTLTPG